MPWASHCQISTMAPSTGLPLRSSTRPSRCSTVPMARACWPRTCTRSLSMSVGNARRIERPFGLLRRGDQTSGASRSQGSRAGASAGQQEAAGGRGLHHPANPTNKTRRPEGPPFSFTVWCLTRRQPAQAPHPRACSRCPRRCAWSTAFIAEADLAAVVDAQHLHLHLVAFVDHVGDLGDARSAPARRCGRGRRVPPRKFTKAPKSTIFTTLPV